MSKYGFVYCLMNEGMPGLYKIGCTEKSPQMRADELSKATGVPHEFCVVCYIECENHKSVEAEIHSLLGEYRSNSRREFFQIDVEKIVAAFFYNSSGISWVDRISYEITRTKPYELKNPYDEVFHGKN